ncbi:hypothetical protein GCK32_001285 [Trichostrongylus colubriformis]|uniref:Uncharacterized protein n=1 Tax=Trichostrongylus colubriformis TaxID=6319 RepID=A0AAN8IDX5_TRICO
MHVPHLRRHLWWIRHPLISRRVVYNFSLKFPDMASGGKPDFLDKWVRRVTRPLPKLTSDFLTKVISRPQYYSVLLKYVSELEELKNELDRLHVKFLEYMEARINYRLYTTNKNERRVNRRVMRLAKGMKKYEENLKKWEQNMEIDMIVIGSVDPEMYKLLSAHGTLVPPSQPKVPAYHSMHSLDFGSQGMKQEYRSMDSLDFEHHAEKPEYHSMESLDFASHVEVPEYHSMESLNYESQAEKPEYHSMESLDSESEYFVADL